MFLNYNYSRVIKVMNILSIDTAGLRMNSFSISLKTDAGIFTRQYDFNSRVFVERLLPVMETIVAEAGISPKDIGAVLVAEGPGSFTGLRLAYSAAKAFALASGAAVVPIPTLACIEFLFRPYSGQILVTIDAKRGSVYGQLFDDMKPVSEIFDKPFVEFLEPLENKKTLCACVGSQTIQADFEAFVKKLENAPDKNRAGSQTVRKDELLFVEVQTTFSLAMLRYFDAHQGELLSVSSNDYQAPIYIRKSDAEE